MRFRVMAAAAALVAMSVCASGSAYAVEPDPDPETAAVSAPAAVDGDAISRLTVTTYEYKYINVSRTQNWTHKGRQLGICKVEAGAAGGTCTISRSYSVSSSIQVEFGLSTEVVGAKIGVDENKTVTGKVSWTSPRAKVGSQYKAWAVGGLVVYQIQKWKVTKAGGITARSLVATSGTLAAFSPVAGFAVGQ